MMTRATLMCALVLLAIACTPGGGGPPPPPPGLAKCAPELHLDLLQPVTDCVGTSPDGRTFAVFGYHNGAASTQTVPLGGNNAFFPSPLGRGQPAQLAPGDHHGVFATELETGSGTWILGDSFVTARLGSAPSCGPIATDSGGTFTTFDGQVVLLEADPTQVLTNTIVPTDAKQSQPNQAPLTTGTTPGAFAVAEDGAATYTMPLLVPPGRAGIQPSISFVYNSHRGNGQLGVGWSLAGLGAIARCPKTLATDGVSQPVTFTDNDRYCLNGDYLIPVTSPLVTNESPIQFAPEHDPFTRVAMQPGGPLGPTSFTVYRSNGLVERYGTCASCLVKGERVQTAAGPDGTTTETAAGKAALVWALSEVADRHQNAMYFDYDLLLDATAGVAPAIEQRPKSIAYTAGPGHDPLRRIEFQYASSRPDPEDAYVAGLHLRTASLLTEVRAYAPAPVEPALVMSYRLAYANTSLTQRSLLSSVQQCDGAGVCMPATTFDWDQGSLAYQDSDLGKDGWGELMVAGDINGDGFDDVLYNKLTVVTVQQAEDSPSDSIYAERYDEYARLSNGTTLGPEFRLASLPYTIIKGFAEHFPPFHVPPTARIADVDMDGRADVLLFNGGDVPTPFSGGTPYRWRLYRFNGTNVEEFATGGTEASGIRNPFDTLENIGDHPVPSLYLGDVDGNGLTDLVRTLGDHADSTWAARFNSAAGLAGAYDSVGAPGTVSADSNDLVLGASLDGSGRTSFLLPTGDRYSATTFVGGHLETVPTTLTPGGRSSDGSHYHMVDVNGDGLTDALKLPNAAAGGFPTSIEINSGNGFLSPRSVSFPAGFAGVDMLAFGGLVRGVTAELIGDYNEDGRADFFIMEPNNRTIVWEGGTGGYDFDIRPSIPVLDPVGASPMQSGVIGHVTGAPQAVTLDIDGDGLTDLLELIPTDPTASSVDFDHLHLHLYRHDGKQADNITSIKTGFGAQTHISYKPYRQGHEVGSSDEGCEFPRYCRAGGFSTVDSFAVDRGDFFGSEGTKRYSLDYAGARSDLIGRGFLGFELRTIYDLGLGSSNATRYDNKTRVGTAYPFAGVAFLARSDVPLGSGRVLSSTSLWSNIIIGGDPAAGQPYRVVPRDQTLSQFDLSLTKFTKTSFSYDDFGNVTYSNSLTGDGYQTTVSTGFDNFSDRWIIGLPNSATVESASPTEHVTRTWLAVNDPAHGDRLSETFEPSGSPDQRLETRYYLNSSGQVTDILQRSADELRIQSVAYDSREELFPVRFTNELGFATYAYFYPSFGQLAYTRDANGAVTTRQYDGMGRLKHEAAPGGEDVHVSYEQAAFAAGQVSVVSAARPSFALQLDTQGRVRRRLSAGFDGTPWTTQVDYNDEHPSKVAFVSRPFGAGAAALIGDRFIYDAIGRTTQISHADGSTSSYAYENLTATQTDEEGRVTRLLYDQSGRAVQRSEFLSGRELKTRYVFGPFGALEQVIDAGGNPTTTRFDDVGRPFSVTTPDSGERVTSYNAFGDVVFDRDAVGNVSRFSYDSLGRMLGRENGDGATCIQWDAAAHGIGQISKATSADGIDTSFEYDGIGRLRRATWTIAGQPYSVGRAYDAAGRVSAVQYPKPGGTSVATGPEVLYKYTSSNYLRAVTDSAGADIWGIDSQTPTEQLEHFANGVSTHRQFDDQRGWLKAISTINPAGNHLQDALYSYTATGDLHSAKDATLGAGIEIFGYDELHRLTSWSDPVDAVDTHYEYDDLDNLVSIAKPGKTISFTIGGTAGPHAVASESDKPGSFAYDANGSLRRSPGRRITYAAMGKPRAVAVSSGETQFTYDSSDRRVVKEGPGGRTTYVGDLYERREHSGGPEEHVFHIFGGGREVATFLWTARGGTVRARAKRYLHDGRGGSINVVTNETGAAIDVQRFDPYGNRVVPTNPAVASSTPLTGPASGITVGYIGLEEDDDLGLINANARLYDPRLARFTSTDVVINPDRPRSLNPYQYALNNPLRYSDPSGFEPGNIKAGLDNSPDYQKDPDGSSWVITTFPNGNGPRGTNAHRMEPPMEKPRASDNGPTSGEASVADAATAGSAAAGGPSPISKTEAYERAEKNAAIDLLTGLMDDAVGSAGPLVRGLAEATGLMPSSIGADFKAPAPETPYAREIYDRHLSDIKIVTAVAAVIIPAVGAEVLAAEGAGVAAEATVPSGDFYSVAFETKLNPGSYPGVTRYMHFKEANFALDAALESNPVLAELGISVPRSPSGSILGKSPEGWVWHHDIEPGVMQLVPKGQHPNIPGGIFWDTMHPGGPGGFSIWGK